GATSDRVGREDVGEARPAGPVRFPAGERLSGRRHPPRAARGDDPRKTLTGTVFRSAPGRGLGGGWPGPREASAGSSLRPGQARRIRGRRQGPGQVANWRTRPWTYHKLYCRNDLT